MNMSDKILEEDLLKAKLPNKRSRYFYKSEIKIPKKSLVMMCGTPGSGKSTLARKICMQSNKKTHIDIDYLFDTTTKDLYPNAKYLTAENIDLIAKEAYDKAYRKAEEALAQEESVLWDNLGIFPTERAEVLNGLRAKYDYSILLVVIDGRQVNSLGASYSDVIELMLEYGAVNAANLDGGSSSLMYYNGEYINSCASMYGPRDLPTTIIIK